MATTWWNSLTPSEQNDFRRKKILEKKLQHQNQPKITLEEAKLAAIAFLIEQGYTIYKDKLKIEPH